LVTIALSTGIKNNGTELYKTVHLQCRLLMDDIVLNEGKYKFLTGIKMYEEILMNIKLILEESEIFQIHNYSTSNDRRDYFMAENILSLLNREKPNAKVIVWAHNLHIAKTSTDYRKAMGSNLSDMLKSEYYAIGFEFYSGSFRSTNMDLKNLKSWDVMSIGDPPAESLPWYFNKTGINKFFIDFRNTGTVNIKNFSKFYRMHSIGASYSIKWPGIFSITLTDFDGMFSFKESTASKYYDIVKN